jgi:hypothetical protein
LKVIGIDDSAAMLQAAREKAQDSGSAALFLQQDITGSSFMAPSTWQPVSWTPSITSSGRRQYAGVPPAGQLLNPGALFIADVGTLRHFAQTRASHHQPDHENLTLVWQNHYRPQSQISRPPDPVCPHGR